MAVPKKRTSRARRDQRRSHLAIKPSAASEACPSCGELKLRHNACPKCGVYKGLQMTKKAEPAAAPEAPAAE